MADDPALLSLPLVANGSAAHKPWNLKGSFSTSVAGLSVVLLAAFAALVKYSDVKATDAHVNQYYMWWVDVLAAQHDLRELQASRVCS